MRSSTINANTFTVSDGNTAISWNGFLQWHDGHIYTVKKPVGFNHITARITTRVKDLAGNTLASDYTWSFTTGDFIAPTVSSTSPVNGATGVAINSTITATFRGNAVFYH